MGSLEIWRLDFNRYWLAFCYCCFCTNRIIFITHMAVPYSYSTPWSLQKRRQWLAHSCDHHAGNFFVHMAYLLSVLCFLVCRYRDKNCNLYVVLISWTSIFCQVQALVGFEKTLKHLDEHLVDISTKVSGEHIPHSSSVIFTLIHMYIQTGLELPSEPWNMKEQCPNSH